MSLLFEKKLVGAKSLKIDQFYNRIVKGLYRSFMNRRPVMGLRIIRYPFNRY